HRHHADGERRGPGLAEHAAEAGHEAVDVVVEPGADGGGGGHTASRRSGNGEWGIGNERSREGDALPATGNASDARQLSFPIPHSRSCYSSARSSGAMSSTSVP